MCDIPDLTKCANLQIPIVLSKSKYVFLPFLLISIIQI